MDTILSRALYEQVGELDETMQMCEFIDWMARARHEGFEEIPVPVVSDDSTNTAVRGVGQVS